MVPLAALLSLAACGGGGGDSTSGASVSLAVPPVPPPPTPPSTPGTPVSVEVVGGNAQVVDAGVTLPRLLAVKVTDSTGNPVANTRVQFSVISGSGTLQSAEFVATDATGIAEAAWRLGPLPGLQRMTAQAGNAVATFQSVALGPATGLAESPPLAVVSARDGNREIYLVGFDGTGARRLTDDPADEESPSWSPDGSRIAFIRDRGGMGSLHVMDANGGNVRPLFPGREAREPAWSPDGTLVGFSTISDGQIQIAVTSPAGGAIQFLTNRPGYHTMPAWSPDGRRLALVSDWYAYDFIYDIYTMNSDGSELTRRTTWSRMPSMGGPAEFFGPAWSKDGSMIAYVYGKVLTAGTVSATVALMSADGSFVKDVAWAGDSTLRDFSDPGALSWSPDGRGLAYTFVGCDPVATTACATPKRRSVKYVALDGTENRILMEDAGDPAWRP